MLNEERVFVNPSPTSNPFPSLNFQKSVKSQKLEILARPGCKAWLLAGHDEAWFLSSVGAVMDLWGADGHAFPASSSGRKAIFHRLSDPRRSCPARGGPLQPGHPKSDPEIEGGKL